MEFNYSKEHIAITDRLVYCYAASLPLLLIMFFLLFTNLKPNEFLYYIGGILILVFYLIFLKRRGNKKIQQMKAFINEESIVVQDNKKTQNILFKDLVKVIITKDTRGQVLACYVYDDNRKSICLATFDNMEVLVDMILQKKPELAHLKVKKEILNWQRPIVFLLFSWGLLFAGLFLFKWFFLKGN